MSVYDKVIYVSPDRIKPYMDRFPTEYGEHIRSAAAGIICAGEVIKDMAAF